MHVLIIEDNAFNAFCLRRLLESVLKGITVGIVNNSEAALAQVKTNLPDLIIVDGDLCASEELHCNGPELADKIMSSNPTLPIIVWTNSKAMLKAFSAVFQQHQKPFDGFHNWSKMVSSEQINNSWTQYFGDLAAWDQQNYPAKLQA